MTDATSCPCCGTPNPDHDEDDCPEREECCAICGLSSCCSLEGEGEPCPDSVEVDATLDSAGDRRHTRPMANEHDDGDLNFYPFDSAPAVNPDHDGLDFYPFEPSDLPPPGHVRGPGPARRSTSRGRAKAGPLGPSRADVDVAELDNRRAAGKR